MAERRSGTARHPARMHNNPQCPTAFNLNKQQFVLGVSPSEGSHALCFALIERGTLRWESDISAYPCYVLSLLNFTGIPCILICMALLSPNGVCHNVSEQIHDSDLLRYLMASSLACAIPCHQVSWKSVFPTLLTANR